MLVITDKRLPTDHSFIQGCLASSLPQVGVEVLFLGLSETYHGLQKIDGVQYHLFKVWPGGMLVEALQIIFVFFRLLSHQVAFDTVFTRNDPMALFLGYLYCNFINKKAKHLHHISFLHAQSILSSKFHGIKYKIVAYLDLSFQRLFLKKAHHIFAISDAMRDLLQARHPSLSHKLDALPLGIQEKDFDSPMEFFQRPIEIAYIGTLAASRRLNILIDAIGLYNRRYGALTLKVWGASHDPRDDEALQAYVTHCGLEEQVRLCGKVPRDQVLKTLMRTKIGVCTIPPDNLYKYSSPTKLMEYLAAGCCVIASGGIPEQQSIIEKSGGGILVSFCAEAIADGIHQLRHGPKDAAMMAAQGRDWILKNRDYLSMASHIKRIASGLA